MGASAGMMMLGSTVLKTVGQSQNAKAQADALQGQASVADYNAQIAKRNAEEVLKVSSSQQLMLRRNQRQQLGRDRAIAAQSGAGTGGSNAEIIAQSETLSELDAMNLAYEGEVRSRGFLAQSEIDTYNAGLYRKQASNVKRANVLTTIGTLTAGYARYKGAL